MPFKYLSKHLNEIKKSKNIYLFEDFDLDEKQKDELVKLCNDKLQNYINKRGIKKIFGHRTLASGVISGSIRYKVLLRAKNRCESCGISNKEKALEVLQFLKIEHLRNERAGNLSGGQKKLLELARTMMVDAKIVFLDEVGAGVNKTLLNDISDSILRLNQEKGYTFCMIEHDFNFITKLCDPIIVLAEGSVLFKGSAEEVKKNEKVIESYLGKGIKK